MLAEAVATRTISSRHSHAAQRVTEKGPVSDVRAQVACEWKRSPPERPCVSGDVLIPDVLITEFTQSATRSGENWGDRDISRCHCNANSVATTKAHNDVEQHNHNRWVIRGIGLEAATSTKQGCVSA